MAVDGRIEVTTQVQIGQSRSHLLYLHMIASQFATAIGMARKDSEDVVRAVTDVCQYSAKTGAPADSSLTVGLVPSGTSLTVEIRGFLSSLEPVYVLTDAPRGLESLCRFVDTVEVVREDAGDMVRLTKYIRKPENAAAVSIQGLSVLQTSGLQS